MLKNKKSKPVLYRLSLLLFISFMASCSETSDVIDTRSNVRMIALAPHLAELAESAGALDSLVGIVSYTQLESEKIIEGVGDAFKVDYEKIISLKPDYVFVWKDGNPASVIHKLKSLGLNVLEIEIQKLADIPRTIEQIAKIAGTESIAQQNINLFHSVINKHKNQFKPQRNIFIETYHQPLYTVSGTHWLSEAAMICGYENTFSEMQPLSAPINIESVIDKNPDVILNIALKKDNQWQKWKDINAVKNNRILTISPNLMSHPNMRLLEGIEKLCEF
ncbi:MAG TPA: ABC transporter substrate-binding protein [Gammaproteobacteria bacterium]|jgi:iron complex transport system substrate-binding protein|nr:ABC transporter substrate-binding protein [Xanthomonadales bacterium]HPQ87886.1 ABC transporter substrate-binding protein [Gammaproteobacteria bacterium]